MSNTEDTVSEQTLSMHVDAQRQFRCILALLVILFGWSMVTQGLIPLAARFRDFGKQTLEKVEAKQSIDFRIDLNHASEAEISLVPGVGPVLAQAILAERSRIGGFKSMKQVDAIRGIGPKISAQLRNYCLIFSEDQK